MPYSDNQDDSVDQREPSIHAEGADRLASVLQAVANELEKGNLLLALDRDGTLAPIADRPEEAIVDDEVVRVLRQLGMSNRITLAFVSARSIAQLQADFVEVKAIIAGNYGLEIRFRPDYTLIQPAASAAIERLRGVRDELAGLTANGINAVLEDHGFSLCLHWQNVPKERRPDLNAQVAAAEKKFSDLLFKTLPTSYEVFPRMEWNKGQALEQIEQRLRAEGRKLGGHVFIGDSAPDEPAFEWVNSKGGVSIRVGSGGCSTVSKQQLSGTIDVRLLLQQLARLAAPGLSRLPSTKHENESLNK